MNRMRTLSVLGAAFFLIVLTALPAIAGGDPVKRCEKEIKGAGFDPSTFTVFVGTDGDDDFGDLAADEAACGFDGADTVGTNRGLFIGGNGDDGVQFNRDSATFNGGGGDDTVILNLDSAVFNGGNGVDTVDTFTSGTCIDVEFGCP